MLSCCHREGVSSHCCIIMFLTRHLMSCPRDFKNDNEDIRIKMHHARMSKCEVFPDFFHFWDGFESESGRMSSRVLVILNVPYVCRQN